MMYTNSNFAFLRAKKIPFKMLLFYVYYLLAENTGFMLTAGLIFIQ